MPILRPRRSGIAATTAAALALPVAGCELSEVTVAEPADLVVAEVVLVAGAARQRAWLHRTVPGPGGAFAVPGATVRVDAVAGGSLRFEPAPLAECVEIDGAPAPPRGSCYVSPERPDFVRPGEAYTLTITVPSGGRLDGSVRVPGAYQVIRPAAEVCRLEPETRLDFVWRPSEDTWAYVVEASLTGFRSAFESSGIPLPGEPLRLMGLSISAADTTLAFPGGIGVFDRYDPDLTALLAALQAGLPDGVDAAVTLAAADRNFVNWVRAASFNPSGQPRIASVAGAGTGVFGALAVHRFAIRSRTAAATALPDC